jgi:hypothetical protein
MEGCPELEQLNLSYQLLIHRNPFGQLPPATPAWYATGFIPIGKLPDVAMTSRIRADPRPDTSGGKSSQETGSRPDVGGLFRRARQSTHPGLANRDGAALWPLVRTLFGTTWRAFGWSIYPLPSSRSSSAWWSSLSALGSLRKGFSRAPDASQECAPRGQPRCVRGAVPTSNGALTPMRHVLSILVCFLLLACAGNSPSASYIPAKLVPCKAPEGDAFASRQCQPFYARLSLALPGASSRPRPDRLMPSG